MSGSGIHCDEPSPVHYTYPIGNKSKGAGAAVPEWAVGYDDGVTYAGMTFVVAMDLTSLTVTGNCRAGSAAGDLNVKVFNAQATLTGGEDVFDTGTISLTGGTVVNARTETIQNPGKEHFKSKDTTTMMAVQYTLTRTAGSGTFYVDALSIALEGRHDR